MRRCPRRRGCCLCRFDLPVGANLVCGSQTPRAPKGAGEHCCLRQSGSGGPLVALFATASAPETVVAGPDLRLIFNHKSCEFGSAGPFRKGPRGRRPQISAPGHTGSSQTWNRFRLAVIREMSCSRSDPLMELPATSPSSSPRRLRRGEAFRRCRRTCRPGSRRCSPTAAALSARAARAPRRRA
jgi:hypothetical protein